MAKKRLIILFVPLAQLAFLELVFFGPKPLASVFAAGPKALFFYLLAFNLLGGALIWLLLTPAAGLAFKIESIFWAWLLANSVILFSFLLPQSFLVHSCYVLSSVLLFAWLKILAASPNKYQSAAANFLVFSSVLAVFFLFSFFYGLESYLNISVWRLSLAMVAVLVGIFYFLLKASNIGWRAGVIYLIINCLVLAEIAWAVFFLPFQFALMGAIFTFCFYLAAGLSRLSLLGKLTAKALKFYLLVGLGSLVLLLLTVRWL